MIRLFYSKSGNQRGVFYEEQQAIAQGKSAGRMGRMRRIKTIWDRMRARRVQKINGQPGMLQNPMACHLTLQVMQDAVTGDAALRI